MNIDLFASGIGVIIQPESALKNFASASSNEYTDIINILHCHE